MMRVAGIIPILLNIINSEQQNQKQTARTSQPQQLLQQYQPSASSTLTTGVANFIKSTATPTQESILLPLPLKTTLFPETQFYTFQKQLQVEDQPSKHAQDKAVGVAFSLTTASLGRLFFTLNQQHDTLRIDCYAEKPSMVAKLNTKTAQLEESVSAVGYSKVVFKCHLLDRHHDPDQSNFTYTGLIDLKI